jgi:DNA polymerase V
MTCAWRPLFDAPSPRAAERMAMMDQLNARFGHDTVFMAAVGIERGWRRHAAFHSPRYTTRIGELPIARG